MYSLELYLTNYGDLRLEEVRFFAEDAKEPLVTTNGGSSAYSGGSNRNLFTWTAGVRAITHLLLIAASGDGPPMIKGEAKSLAASLDYALSKEPGWLLDFFGVTARGTAVARNLFGRRNAERKRPGPVEVFLNDSLLPRNSISIFVNGSIFAAGQKLLREEILTLLGGKREESAKDPEIVVPTASSSDPNSDKSSTAEFPLVATSRELSMFVDLDTGKNIFRLASRYRNVSKEPTSFLHYNIYGEGSRTPQNVRITNPEEGPVAWTRVIGVDGRARLLVTFREPLLPEQERREELYFEVHNMQDLDHRLSYPVHIPTDHLILEMTCNPALSTLGWAVIAERDDDFLFTTLPQPQLSITDNGQPRIRWSLENPELGFVYRLLWGLQRTTPQ